MSQMIRFEKAAPGVLDLIARLSMYIAVLIIMTFILVAVAAPAAPQLLWPFDNAQNVPSSQILSWRTVEGAEFYDVQMAVTEDFSEIFAIREALVLTQAPMSAMSYGVTYYWRARCATVSELGEWSAVRRFTTAQPAPSEVVELLSPVNGTVCEVDQVSVRWTAVEGVTSYAIQVAQNADFAAPLADMYGINATTFTIGNLLSGQTYYLRIAAENAAGRGPWSQPSEFTAASIENQVSVLAHSTQPSAMSFTVTPSHIAYTFAAGGTYTLKVFDMAGRQAAASNGNATAGYHQIGNPARALGLAQAIIVLETNGEKLSRISTVY